METVEGAIEVIAGLFRKGGRWVIEINAPAWVMEEIVSDLRRETRGAILSTRQGAMLLREAPVPGEVAPKAAPAHEPRLQTAMKSPESVVREPEPQRVIQTMPEGLVQPGKPLVVPERPRAETPPINHSVATRLRDSIRACDEQQCALDIDAVCQEHTLTERTARRRVQQLLAESVEKGHITAASSAVILPPLPKRNGGNRKGIKLNYSHSEESKAKMRATKAANKAARLAAAQEETGGA